MFCIYSCKYIHVIRGSRAHENLLMVFQSSSKSTVDVSELIKICWWCVRAHQNLLMVSALMQICWWCVRAHTNLLMVCVRAHENCWWCGRAHENLLMVWQGSWKSADSVQMTYRPCVPAWPPRCSGWWWRWWWPAPSRLHPTNNQQHKTILLPSQCWRAKAEIFHLEPEPTFLGRFRLL